VPVVVSSGDSGFGLDGTLGGTQFPASLPTVTAVGGTTLTKDPGSARGWDETAWSGSGSGCSAYFAKPGWQRDAHCGMRTVADVAAVADPKTGVAVYDSYLPGGLAGWLVVGGTSAAAPLIAGVYALAGNAAQAASPAYLYAHTRNLYDVTSGSNGTCGVSNYLCNAKHGYDGPTGLGTPDGAGAF
jgi:subtilase family serine protease